MEEYLNSTRSKALIISSAEEFMNLADPFDVESLCLLSTTIPLDLLNFCSTFKDKHTTFLFLYGDDATTVEIKMDGFLENSVNYHVSTVSFGVGEESELVKIFLSMLFFNKDLDKGYFIRTKEDTESDGLYSETMRQWVTDFSLRSI